jgi:magnesium transporter
MTTEQEIATTEARLRELMLGDDADAARELLESLHPADQADVFDRLDDEHRPIVLSLLPAEGIAHLLEYLDEDVRRDLVEEIPRASLAQILDRTDNDIAVDVLREMPAAEAVRTLAQMRTAAEIMPLLQHGDETAGGIMTRGYIALHKDMTAQEAISFLRATKPLPDEAYYLYVLDSRSRLQGIVNLRELIVSDPSTRIEDVMTSDLVTVGPGVDQEDAARMLQHYRLRSLPVVDEEGVLQGIITSDDIIDVIQEEATEDMFRMAGLSADESVFAPVSVSARLRIPWLVINLGTALLAGAVVAAFEGTIEKAAALAAFMPIIAGQGGNAGIQTVTIVVRSLALGEIESQDALPILRKEVGLGVVRGVLFGVLVGAIAYAWQGEWAWGVVVGASMLLIMLVAGVVGTVIPLGMRALRIDPAIASGVFLTTATDILGFFFLLGLATLMIDQLS